MIHIYIEGELSGLEHMELNYENNITDNERNLVEKSIQQGVSYNIPPNSYALILTTKDDVSTEAIFGKSDHF